MTLKTSMWRVEASTPTPLTATPLDLEGRLEDLIVADPDLLGPDQLLIIDRQVRTSHGKYLDILAVDEEARLHAIELKKDRTPRDVVAQALDYGWWIRSVTLSAAREIWDQRSVEDGVDTDLLDLDQAYEKRFKIELDEETFNAEHKLTIVASTLDTDTPRILEYLADDYAVPINAVLFDHFEDEGREYLSRTWLRAPGEDEAKPSPKRSGRGQRKTWNGRDIFMPLGRAEDDPTSARWHLGLKYGFVGAGGGAAYWKFLRRIEPGMRIFAYVAQAGYIAVGEATGELRPLEELVVEYEGQTQRFVDTPDCPHRYMERINSDDPDLSEYAVPVDWTIKRGLSDAVWEPGMFANQLPCRFKNTQTIAKVESEMGLAPSDFSELGVGDRLKAVDAPIRGLFDDIEALAHDHDLSRTDTKWYVNFVTGDGTAVTSVVIRKNALKAYVDMDHHVLSEQGYETRDVSDIGHHGSGRTEITIRDKNDLGALEQALRATSAT